MSGTESKIIKRQMRIGQTSEKRHRKGSSLYISCDQFLICSPLPVEREKPIYNI